jgi:hypothetical protein
MKGRRTYMLKPSDKERQSRLLHELAPHVLRPTVLSDMKDNRATALSAEVKLGARGVPALTALDVRH